MPVVPFAYYNRLSRAGQRTYRRSDEIADISLRQSALIAPLARDLESALSSEDRAAVQRTAGALLTAIREDLGVPRFKLKVLAARPDDDWGELHGLYTLAEEGAPAEITVWMRTAKRRQVVAFRTFLRTLLHELCHHLDYELLRLDESYHTEGFYKRESSLFKQLVVDQS